MESWVSLGGKDHTKISILAEPGIEPGALWLHGGKAEILPTAPLIAQLSIC